MIRVYHYPKCSTCRKALAWLDARGLEYEKLDIVANPPSRTILAEAASRGSVDVRKMFNTSGQSYREGNFKERASSMSEEEMLEALAADGKLIKRPLLISDETALVGFKAEAWAEALKTE